MPQKSAPKTTRAKKSTKSTSSAKTLSTKESKPTDKNIQKDSGMLTPLLIVGIVFAGFIGYYIADQRAITELNAVISQCQQSYRY